MIILIDFFAIRVQKKRDTQNIRLLRCLTKPCSTNRLSPRFHVNIKPISHCIKSSNFQQEKIKSLMLFFNKMLFFSTLYAPYYCHKQFFNFRCTKVRFYVYNTKKEANKMFLRRDLRPAPLSPKLKTSRLLFGVLD